ncbi:methyltransferase domain-containing protein [Nonomuraea sp. NPDC050328]|uniref:methyltransferase domain-containing protein n=1 Tax=Nonomuraea sp. NPDC050328 TaxID=3364361 RepID=UPI003799EF76
MKTEHRRHAHDGDHTIDRPRAYEVFSALGFLGRRREIFTRLAALSGVRPGASVLDVGCGTGYLTRLLAPVAGPSGRVTGVDPSEAMIGYARERAPRNCDYRVAGGQSLGLPDAAFDVVVSTLAVHHIPEGERATALHEMARVLRPGGRLLIAEARPPAGRLPGRVAATFFPALRHGVRDELGGLIEQAGLRPVDSGDLPVLLGYVRAERPE